MKIVLAEDNIKLSGYIKKALEASSYSVDAYADGEAAESAAERGCDLIILDVMLPKKDGIAVARELRARGVMTPILMLTAKGELDDKVLGLDSGADDYMVKPFELAELLARLRALLRRPIEKFADVLSFRDIVIDPTEYSVRKGDEALLLTVKEYAVLEYLVRNKNRTLTREQILEHCWDFAFDSYSNIVDVYIKQLRSKIGDTDGEYIKTIRGIGYQAHE
jgi:DNA-binding response OmpR family regulator